MPVPPLRDARDIPLLAQFLIDKFGACVGRRIETVEPDDAGITTYRGPETSANWRTSSNSR